LSALLSRSGAEETINVKKEPLEEEAHPLIVKFWGK
jgi:hypothetical protein